jgi:hypothetical protein
MLGWAWRPFTLPSQSIPRKSQIKLERQTVPCPCLPPIATPRSTQEEPKWKRGELEGGAAAVWWYRRKGVRVVVYKVGEVIQVLTSNRLSIKEQKANRAAKIKRKRNK